MTEFLKIALLFIIVFLSASLFLKKGNKKNYTDKEYEEAIKSGNPFPIVLIIIAACILLLILRS